MARKYEWQLGDFRKTGRKTCAACGQEKSLFEFYSRANRSPKGVVERSYSYRCKECDKAAVRAINARNANNAERVKLPATKYCGWCKETKPAAAFLLNRKTRDGLQYGCYTCHRDRRYGLESGEYDRLMKEQDGKCAICRQLCPRQMELSVDHDHITGRVRGLLCQNCNAGLGMFKDDPSLLARAISYVTEGGGHQ